MGVRGGKEAVERLLEFAPGGGHESAIPEKNGGVLSGKRSGMTFSTGSEEWEKCAWRGVAWQGPGLVRRGV